MTPKPSSVVRPVYESPRIFRIRVAGDELSVAGCKTSSSASGPNVGCNIPPASPCKGLSS